MNKNHVNYTKKIGCSKETRPDYQNKGVWHVLRELSSNPTTRRGRRRGYSSNTEMLLTRQIYEDYINSLIV